VDGVHGALQLWRRRLLPLAGESREVATTWQVARDDWQWTWPEYSARVRANAVGIPSILH